jgi:hypothetical protein
MPQYAPALELHHLILSHVTACDDDVQADDAVNVHEMFVQLKEGNEGGD